MLLGVGLAMELIGAALGWRIPMSEVRAFE